MKDTHPDLLKALRGGEISIHKAWQWGKTSTAVQGYRLKQHRDKRGISARINELLSKHSLIKKPVRKALSDLRVAVAALRDTGCFPLLSPLIEQLLNEIERVSKTASGLSQC